MIKWVGVRSPWRRRAPSPSTHLPGRRSALLPRVLARQGGGRGRRLSEKLACGWDTLHRTVWPTRQGCNSRFGSFDPKGEHACSDCSFCVVFERIFTMYFLESLASSYQKWIDLSAIEQFCVGILGTLPQLLDLTTNLYDAILTLLQSLATLHSRAFEVGERILPSVSQWRRIKSNSEK